MDMDTRYWDEVAPKWSQEIFNTLKHDRRRVIVSELERAARSGKSVADFGCGIGNYLPRLARLFDEVHGFDHSEACIELARLRMQRRRKVSLYQAATAPRFAKGQYDVVLCVNTAIHPKRSEWLGVLRSATSMLKPDGRLILVVPSAESAALIAKAEQATAEKNRAANESHTATQGVVSIEGVPTKHYARTELSDALTGVGLHVGRIRRVEYTWQSQAVTPPRELRYERPWDWLAVAKNTATSSKTNAA
ncbi:MAG TPA: methyltransferase domain-containing protein [Candidatus Hydrogenedentes bacterium]|nr:methyltransferase domain-containing protein [Candidatus Hydrogenedentota bacterium]HRK35224.1 methyltransferase domain-containing protein [Candidatus Hydrogenedentota bacterium]